MNSATDRREERCSQLDQRMNPRTLLKYLGDRTSRSTLDGRVKTSERELQPGQSR